MTTVPWHFSEIFFKSDISWAIYIYLNFLRVNTESQMFTEEESHHLCSIPMIFRLILESKYTTEFYSYILYCILKKCLGYCVYFILSRYLLKFDNSFPVFSASDLFIIFHCKMSSYLVFFPRVSFLHISWYIFFNLNVGSCIILSIMYIRWLFRNNQTTQS